MLGVDPGVHHSGIAYSREGRIVHAELWPTERGPAPMRGDLPIPWRAIVEIPQVYRGGRARTADLVHLAAAAGRVAALHTPTYRRPAEWKGQLPKEVQHARMWTALDAEETALLQGLDCKPALRHNVYDAVCILLREHGRLR